MRKPAAGREVGAAGARWGDSGTAALGAAPPPALGERPRVWVLLAPPRPRGPAASPPSLAPGRWGPRRPLAPPALTGLPRPRPLQQPLRGPHVLRLHRLHQLLLLPHGAAGPQRRSALRALGGSEAAAAPRLRPHPLRAACAARRPAPSRARARAPRGGQRVTGGGRPGGGGRRRTRGGGAAPAPPPGRLGPLLRPLTSVSQRQPRARLRGSAPAPGPSPRRPLPTCGPAGRSFCGRRGPETTVRGWGGPRRGWAVEPRRDGGARLSLGEASRGCRTQGGGTQRQ